MSSYLFVAIIAYDHHSKFPDNPDATRAFQKVAVAYDVLSKPHLKRLYDARPPSAAFDVFATRPMGHAEETFQGVVLGVFNDFLDGDLEMIRTLLSACHPALFFTALLTLCTQLLLTTSIPPSNWARTVSTRCSSLCNPSVNAH